WFDGRLRAGGAAPVRPWGGGLLPPRGGGGGGPGRSPPLVAVDGEAPGPVEASPASGSTTIIRDLEGLAGISSLWDRLARSTGSPMQQHAWGVACAAIFAEESRLRVFLTATSPCAAAIA